jgi:GxxExxY protein
VKAEEKAFHHKDTKINTKGHKEDRRQRSEDRRQRAEREQRKTADRRQRTEREQRKTAEAAEEPENRKGTKKTTQFKTRSRAMTPDGPAHTEDAKKAADDLSRKIIGAAIEVHRHLGPGLLENAYETCLCRELELQGIPFQYQHPVDLEYKGITVSAAYRIDLLVTDLVVIEIKSVEKLEPVHEAQLLTYLRLYKRWLGLLINFNVPVLKDGIKRRVLG